MVDFPASHVSFQGGVSVGTVLSHCGPSDSSNEGLQVETKEGTVLVIVSFEGE